MADSLIGFSGLRRIVYNFFLVSLFCLDDFEQDYAKCGIRTLELHCLLAFHSLSVMSFQCTISLSSPFPPLLVDSPWLHNGVVTFSKCRGETWDLEVSQRRVRLRSVRWWGMRRAIMKLVNKKHLQPLWDALPLTSDIFLLCHRAGKNWTKWNSLLAPQSWRVPMQETKCCCRGW